MPIRAPGVAVPLQDVLTLAALQGDLPAILTAEDETYVRSILLTALR
jgi:hypothetical protein